MANASDYPLSTHNLEDPAAGADGEPSEERLLSVNFCLATLVNFFNSFGSQMMNAIVPVYVLSIGGNNAEAGVVGGAAAITALLLRPLVGWASDVWKRRPLVLIGNSGIGLASVVYALSNSIRMLTFGRVVQGLGISCYSTASNAYIVDIAPSRRRAEAIGLFAATNSLGRIVGPAVGFYIVSLFGYHRLFNLVTALVVTAGLVSLLTRERSRPPNSQRPAWSPRTGIVAVDALPIAWTSFCLGLAFGSVSTFIAIFASSRGIDNPGLYFAVQAIALLISRTFSGRLADKCGRAAAIIPGAIVMALALVVLPLAHDLAGFIVCGALMGLGFGAAQPASMALLADLVGAERQGVGLATYFMGYDGGIFLGSVAFGVVSELWGFGVMWPLAAVWTLLGLLGLLGARRSGVSRSA
ncbi:MAG TPA: MFS transporter [Anaerolineae bacterium]|nr:MFS transporter [Anaerolineae bacterium]